jgi:hypothetical protein
MKEEKFNELKDLYGKFIEHKDYEYRQNNLAVSPIFREIIHETLNNIPFEQKHLTGLIQVFKIKVSKDTFYNYLNQLIPHQETQDRLSAMYYALGYPGFTGAGLNSVTKLDSAQCDVVKHFCKRHFTFKLSIKRVHCAMILNPKTSLKLSREYIPRGSTTLTLSFSRF